MPQSLTQQQLQEQKLVQQQHITQRQLLTARLLSMSLAELEQNVDAEIYDNPALEVVGDVGEGSLADDGDDQNGENTDTTQDQDDFRDEFTTALNNMESDDEEQEREIVYADIPSFRDKIEEQVGELTLSERERDIVDYLVGSLNDDGFLRKDLGMIVDELAIYEGIDTTEEEVERLLKEVQTFDPAGIGARNLQECLSLQIERKREGILKECMMQVVGRHFDLLMKGRWDKIKTALHLNDTQVDTLREEFRRLNPKPGATFGETMGRSTQHITPDVIVYPTADGRIRFDINTGNLPTLVVSETFADMMETYQGRDVRSLSKTEEEAMVYVKRNVERANLYMEALAQRQRTMELTMRAIIAWQKSFFLSGEESDLRPMILKDIAQKTGLDISTISRVSNEKYAQTQWGIFPLKYFFSDGLSTEEGEELSLKAAREALRDIVVHEDKCNPLSDEALAMEMKRRGFAVARRTVAKYRNQLGIPTSHLRKTR